MTRAPALRDLTVHRVIPHALALTLALTASCGEDDRSAALDAKRIVDCTSGAACGADGETCTNGDQRCACAEHGGALVCEAMSCPSTPVGEGTPCSTPGMICDPDFEFAGYRCTGPENVFTECLPGGTYDSRCPYLPPVEGAPCCWVNLAALDPCTYRGDTAMWSCESDHWVRRP